MMKLLIFLILVLALYPIAYHWKDFKEFYDRLGYWFLNWKDRKLGMTIFAMFNLLVVYFVVVFLAY